MENPAPPLVEDRFLYAMALPRPRLPLKGKVAAPAGPVSQRSEKPGQRCSPYPWDYSFGCKDPNSKRQKIISLRSGVEVLADEKNLRVYL